MEIIDATTKLKTSDFNKLRKFVKDDDMILTLVENTSSSETLFEFETNESETEAATIKSIKDVFTKAKENAPSIVFIDELEKYQYNELTGHGRNPVGVHGLKVDDLSRRSVENIVLFKLLHKKYILGEIRI